jgi:prepilin-type N-terminal cleavage/methylation domain-containing protein
LSQRMHAMRRTDAGFTLIELLVVVVILGVLAGIVVFAVSNFNGDGVKSACKADIKNTEIAGEAYFAKQNKYADSTATLVTAGYLHEAPPSKGAANAKYYITYTADNTVTPPTMKVTGNVAAGDGDCTL